MLSTVGNLKTLLISSAKCLAYSELRLIMTHDDVIIQDLRAENAQLRKQIDRMQDTIENLRWQIENTEDDGK